MNEVRFIQKIGQVPMATLVENAAKLGFVLAGSPTLVSNVPAQLMIQADKPALEPEYRIVEKTGQLKLHEQVEALLDEGWQIYGSMLSGEVPMQAMVRGDIGVYSMYGIGSGGAEPGPAPADWQKEIARVDESLTEIYAVLNSLHDYGPDIANAQADGQIYLEQRLADMAERLSYREGEAAKRVTEEINNSINPVLEGQGVIYDKLDTLDAAMAMETSERQQDVARLHERIDQMTRIIAQLVDQPAS